MDTTTNNLELLSKEEILLIIKKFIIEVMGKDFADELDDIDSQTSFANDLEMDSIEIVEFTEKLKAYFGEQIQFNTWLSTMELEQIISLKVGDIVNYIDGCKN